jgi:cytochrome c553
MSNLSLRTLTGIITTGLMLTASIQAQAEDMAMPEMLKVIEQRLQDDAAKQEAIEAGKERALLCKYCHGEDGNSLKPDVPNLAGQNASYLLEQVDKFATGERDDFVMTPLAANFTPEDKINLAIFYFSMPVKAEAVDPELAAKGESLFTSVCSSCHGVKGHGNQKLARLAGQQTVYVMNVLKTFRSNANSPAARKEASRKSAVMEGVAKNLSDAQIKAVATYVTQLP